MAITVKSISVSGESTVSTGKFEFSYNISNDVLSNVSATLVDSETHDYKASFNKDNSNISINLPSGNASILAGAVADFTALCEEIAANVEPAAEEA